MAASEAPASEKQTDMKKILLMAFAIIAFVSNAFETIGTYSVWNGLISYKVKVSSLNKDSTFSYMIQVGGFKSFNDEIYIELNSNDVDKFLSAMQQAKNKFNEWKEIAKDNNLKDVFKQMDIDLPEMRLVWKGSRWFCSKGFILSPHFNVGDNLEYCTLSLIGIALSQDNKYISKKYQVVFLNNTEVDGLLYLLNNKNVYEQLRKKAERQNLLK